MDGKSLDITEERLNKLKEILPDAFRVLQSPTTATLVPCKIDESIIKTVISEKPKKLITLDRLFKNNDQLKTNTALQMKDVGIEFKAV